MFLKEKRENDDPKSSKYYFVTKESISSYFYFVCWVWSNYEEAYWRRWGIYVSRLALLSYSFVFIQCDDLCPVCLWSLVSAEPYVAVAKKVDVHSKYPPDFMLSLTANNFLFFLLSNTFKLPLVHGFCIKRLRAEEYVRNLPSLTTDLFSPHTQFLT